MLVKTKDRVIDPNKEPVMLILTQEDKENLANMHPLASMYLSYPDDYFKSQEEIEAFMSGVLKEEEPQKE